ncbi:hypothetical protein S40288_06742 [Stachybotrys chartarum IBT 40288]|nr:hypothetical protein S40288_06742 [Stachybotrys chartarum IBT 40288]
MASDSDIRIEFVDQPDDIVQGFECLCATFGRQTHDGIFKAMNPGWDTPEGHAAGAQRMIDRWQAAKRTAAGDLSTIFLKATVPDAKSPGGRVVGGLAIWLQASVVPGHGEAPVEDLSQVMDLEAVYPGDKDEQRYLVQLDRSLHGRRIELVKAKAGASPPAVMVLDLCIVHPEHQGKGLGRRLVQWGLDEAERRGGLEAVTEASPMGRKQYEKLGFKGVLPEIEYVVDAQWEGRSRPSNQFMRTRPE